MRDDAIFPSSTDGRRRASDRARSLLKTGDLVQEQLKALERLDAIDAGRPMAFTLRLRHDPQ
jgi:hypothetical protein